MGVAAVKTFIRATAAAGCPSIQTVLAAPPLKPPKTSDLPVAFIDRTVVTVGGGPFDTFAAAAPQNEVRFIVLVEKTADGTLAEDALESVQAELVEWLAESAVTATVTAGDRYIVSESEYRSVVAAIRIADELAG